jgi:magnesium and cobalt transporter
MAGIFRVKALTEIADFNVALRHRASATPTYDTVGGLVVGAFERVPKRGEETSIGGMRFRVLRADSRRVHLLLVERAAAAA